MRTLFIAVAAALALTALGSATAANQTVTITRTGFVPADVTVNVGETVTWRNTDTNSHQVAFDRAPCNLTISSGQSASCTFRAGGRFSYQDRSQQPRLRGTVTVNGPRASVTLAAPRTTATFSAPVTLSGVLSSQAAGESVTINAQECGKNSFTRLGSANTAAGGNWTFIGQAEDQHGLPGALAHKRELGGHPQGPAGDPADARRTAVHYARDRGAVVHRQDDRVPAVPRCRAAVGNAEAGQARRVHDPERRHLRHHGEVPVADPSWLAAPGAPAAGTGRHLLPGRPEQHAPRSLTVEAVRGVRRAPLTPNQRGRTTTSLSTPDSAPHSSPGRPRSCRTLAGELGSRICVNR